MAGYGSGVLTQLVIDGNTVSAYNAEAFSVTPAPDSFETAAGHPMDRGSGTVLLSAICHDYDLFDEFNTLMEARSGESVAATFASASGTTVETYNPMKVRVTPQFLTLQPEKIMLGTGAASLTDLDTAGTGWTDLGPNLGDVAAIFEVPEFTAGRLFYFDHVRTGVDLTLPDTMVSALSSFPRGTSCQVALKFAADVWLVLDEQRVTALRQAPRDGTSPRSAMVSTRGVHAGWTSGFSFHNGSDAAVTTGLDFRFPFLIECMGQHHAAESELLTFS